MSTPGSFLSEFMGQGSQGDQSLASNTTYACSRVTNSYGKCVDEISPKFSPAIAAKLREVIGPHDRNSFDQKILLGEVSTEELGVKRVTGRRYLRVRGTYENKLFAHLKKVEAWIIDESV